MLVCDKCYCNTLELISMGNECCMEKVYDSERVINEMEEFDKLAAFKKKSNRKRVALPTLLYAHKLDKTNETEQSLLQYKLNQRKFKRPTKIEIEPQPQNRIDEVYYLNHESAYYIGEWVFDYDAGDNIPQGIGKLYQRRYISEGEIQTEVLKHLDSITLRTYLNGKGRKYNKLECMEGEFIKGKLWGRGTYTKRDQIEDGEQTHHGVDGNLVEYSYEGIWMNGERHGRGREETNTYIYIGDFVHDVRQGNGNYTNKLDGEKRYKISIQQEGFHDKIKELINEEKANKDRIAKLEQERKVRQEQIENILKHYPWQNPFIKQSLFDHPDFKRERKIRTFYQQTYNGQFKHDKFHGQGTYTWYNGKIYTGNWVEGEMHGVGEFCWPDGTIYRGLYQHDKRHGKGQMIWCDIRKWRGSWAYGVRHGYGQTICIDAEYKSLTIQGALWNKDKQSKIYFTKTHDLKTGLPKAECQQDLLNGQQIPQENQEPLHFQNDPIFAITSMVEKSLSQSIVEKPLERHKQYGTEATWMRLNAFDS